MKTVDVVEAQISLAELIDSREVVIITRHGRQVAIIKPIRECASDVASRIRANPCIDATSDEVAALIRAGRR